ncbi:MAG: TonB-dependent receptor [Phascolarctobacterium sp.]|nr:TonB-dependent receptor [Phascolarctobacterium sp.]
MKKSLSQKVLAAILLGTGILSASVALAEEVEPTFELDQIVVTAGRIEQTLADSNASVNVVSRKEIEEKHYQTVTEALRNVPGVTIQNYSATGANYSSDYLYINGTSHVLVLVDGQRANTNGSVSSVFQPSEVSNMDNIERIEVLKGSASTLYGSDAVGGVINIITRKPTPGVSTKVSAVFGSYNKRTYSIYNQGMTKSGFYWTINGQKDDMRDYKDGYGNNVVNRIDSKTYGAKIGQKFGDKADVSVSYSRYKNDYIRPDKDSSDPVAINGKKDNQKYAVNFVYHFNDKLTNTFNFFSRTADLDDNTNNPIKTWTMREKTWGISDQLTYKNGPHTIVGGFDYYKDAMNEYHDQYTPSLTGTVDNKAFYIQDTMEFGPLTFTPGIRFSKHSEYGNKTSASAVIGYKTSEATNVYVSYKEFFRAPYLYELYNPFYGSEKLKPEEGETYEVGMNTRIDNKTTFSCHVFRTNSDNLIGFNSATWKYYNAGEERITGWDMQITKQFDKQLSASLAYTRIHIPATSAWSNENRNGYIPKHTYDIRINYEQTKFNAFATIKGIVDRPGNKSYEKDVLDSFKTVWTMNLGVNYKPVKGMNIFFNANNLFNRMYTDTCYDMRHPGGAGWYSQPGRNFLAGVEYTF